LTKCVHNQSSKPKIASFVIYKTQEMEYSKSWLSLTLIIIVSVLIWGCAEKSSSHYFKNGSAKYSLKDFNGAIKDLDKSIELQDNYAEAFYVRALCYGELGELSKAALDFNKVLELKPDYKEVYLNRAYYIKTAKNDFEGAIKDYTQFIKLNEGGNSAFAFNNRGFAKYKLERYADALMDIDSSIKIDPKNSFAYKNKALIHIALDSNDKACMNLSKAIELGYQADSDDEVQRLIQEYCKK
jgi:tetratricopeptide (TPR) repeat protein